MTESFRHVARWKRYSPGFAYPIPRFTQTGWSWILRVSYVSKTFFRVMSLDKNLSRFDKVRRVLGAHKWDQERQTLDSSALAPCLPLCWCRRARFNDGCKIPTRSSFYFRRERARFMPRCWKLSVFVFFFRARNISSGNSFFFFALKCYTRRTLTIVESTEKIWAREL